LKLLSLAVLLGSLVSLSLFPQRTAAMGSLVKHTPHYCTSSWQMYRVTGYLATGNRTYSGTWPTPYYTVGTDMVTVPIGAYVQVKNHAGHLWLFLHAEDTGAISGRWLDVFVPTLQDAYAVTGWYEARWSFFTNFECPPRTIYG
jgi:3D (Asp-Asp-Asp) domain-containing protein